jgi:lipopolysaccharide transport system ATP-binding protein
MYVRLAFAVAAHLEPEILIVDEVLAVGDAEFQRKAVGKMNEVSKGKGRTVLFVSHNMGILSQLCNGAILMTNGTLTTSGGIDTTIAQYLEQSYTRDSQVGFAPIPGLKGQVLRARLLDENNEPCNEIPFGKSPKLEIEYQLNQKVKGFHIAMILSDSFGNHIYSSADTDLEPRLLQHREPGNYRVQLDVPTLLLNIGKYNISLGMGIVNEEIFHRVDALTFEIVEVDDIGIGKESGRRRGLLLVRTRWNYL